MTLLSLALSNVLIALLLAVPATLASLWGRRPALTHALWLLVLLKLVTPPLFEAPIAWPQLAEPIAQQPIEPAPAEREEAFAEAREQEWQPPVAEDAEVPAEPMQLPAPQLPVPVIAPVPPVAPIAAEAAPEIAAPVTIEEVLLLVWLAGSLGWLLLAAARLWRFQRLLRFAEPAPAHVLAMARELADALQVRCPDIGLLPGQVSPMLWGLGRTPRLLLPTALLDRLPPDQLATLLAHELAHWRRRDDRVRWLELAVLAIHWWCPLAWWARRELQRAEEECCDAWVVAVLPESARAYALALVETVDFLSGAPAPVPLAASGLGRVRFLKRRLTMILQGKTPRTLTLTGLLGVAGVGVLLLPLFFGQRNEVRIDAQAPFPQGNRNNFDPNQLEQFERTRAEIQQMQKEIEKLQNEIQRRQQDIERRAQELERAVRQAREKNAGPRPGVGGPGGMPPGGAGGGAPPGVGGGPGMPGMPGGWPAPSGNIDHRLKQVEAKLDAVLAELRELRRAKGGKAANFTPMPMPNPMPMPMPMGPGPKVGNRFGGPPMPGVDPMPGANPPLANPLPGGGAIPPQPPGPNVPGANPPRPPQPMPPPPPPEDNKP